MAGPKCSRWSRHPYPDQVRGRVLVRVTAASVTWWDSGFRRNLVNGPPGRPKLALPIQLGREGAGEVAARGEGTSRFNVGDRVVLMVNPACGTCHVCKRGDDHLCVNVTYPGHQRPGSYAQYVVAPERDLIPSPDNVSDEALACSLWSYGTVFHMVNACAKIRPGESVLITGASSGLGTAGLQLARLAGATPIIGLTGSPEKTEMLLKGGADYVLNYHDEDIVEQIRRLSGGYGVDVVLDNVGGERMVQLALDSVRLAGRVVIAAIMGGRHMQLHIAEIFRKHIAILGSRSSTRFEQEQIVQFVKAGKISPMITAKFPLTRIREAHALLDSGKHTGKIVVLPWA
ncbi:MAG: zinc-binding dehydrogenase [Steroidobacteraceae bacterium]